jgi:hypothetical protein
MKKNTPPLNYLLLGTPFYHGKERKAIQPITIQQFNNPTIENFTL